MSPAHKNCYTVLKLKVFKIIRTTGLIIMFSLLACLSHAQKSKNPGNNITKIYNLYLDIKNALIKDDGSTARIKANELYYILSTQPDKGLNWKQCRELADNLEPLLDNTREIGYTISENEQRPYFANLSKSLYDLMKALRMNTSKIYMQYCPLNRAYWMSETAVIKNPYYNYKEWSTVGKTTEILSPL